MIALEKQKSIDFFCLLECTQIVAGVCHIFFYIWTNVEWANEAVLNISVRPKFGESMNVPLLIPWNGFCIQSIVYDLMTMLPLRSSFFLLCSAMSDQIKLKSIWIEKVFFVLTQTHAVKRKEKENLCEFTRESRVLLI